MMRTLSISFGLFCAAVLAAPMATTAFQPLVRGVGSSSSSSTTRHASSPLFMSAKDMEAARTFQPKHHEWGILGSYLPKMSSTTPFLTVVAGWTLASQVAFASVELESPPTVDLESMLPKESPSILTSATVETMDFSLPSYDASSPKKEAPSFNPFGDFKPEIISGGENLKAADEERAAAEAAKAEERASAKAAADARKEEDRVAREARKAEEKAAAEAAKAERAAEEATRKAEKEARRLEELEKQRSAVERQKETSVGGGGDEGGTAAVMPSFEMPDFTVKAPDIKIPDFKAPDIKIPDFKAPDLSGFKTPEMPKFDMPKFDMPDLPAVPSASSGGGADGMAVPKFTAPEMPKFTAPEMPKFAMPKFDLPDLPKPPSSSSTFSDGGGATGAAPKVSLPSVSLPAFSNPFGGSGGGSDSSNSLELESQEVRDEAAREARQVFLAADADAKEAEAAARKVRDVANEKAKLAAAAKDEACETRPGGKLLCLRNPFTSGY